MRNQMPNHSFGLLQCIVQGVISLIILALIVTAVLVILMKYRKGELHLPTVASMPAAEADPFTSALKLLNERLANGDIDVDDYYARRAALKGPDPSSQS